MEHGAQWPEDRKATDPTTVVEEALDVFGKREEYNAAVKVVDVRKAVKAKVSGTLIAEVTGREGRVIGDVLKHFKRTLTSEDVLGMSDEKIRETILEVQKDWDANRERYMEEALAGMSVADSQEK